MKNNARLPEKDGRVDFVKRSIVCVIAMCTINKHILCISKNKRIKQISTVAQFLNIWKSSEMPKN